MQKKTDLFQSPVESSNLLSTKISAMADFVQTETQANLLFFLAVGCPCDICSEVYISKVCYIATVAITICEAARHLNEFPAEQN